LNNKDVLEKILQLKNYDEQIKILLDFFYKNQELSKKFDFTNS
jgi:hypothetical protein